MACSYAAPRTDTSQRLARFFVLDKSAVDLFWTVQFSISPTMEGPYRNDSPQLVRSDIKRMRGPRFPLVLEGNCISILVGRSFQHSLPLV